MYVRVAHTEVYCSRRPVSTRRVSSVQKQMYTLQNTHTFEHRDNSHKWRLRGLEISPPIHHLMVHVSVVTHAPTVVRCAAVGAHPLMHLRPPGVTKIPSKWCSDAGWCARPPHNPTQPAERASVAGEGEGTTGTTVLCQAPRDSTPFTARGRSPSELCWVAA